MNILLTGAVSLSNKGTAAIVISTINLLRKKFPNSSIFIELFYPNIQKTILDIESEYKAKIYAPKLQSPLKAIFYITAAAMTAPLRKIGLTPKIKGLEVYENADVVIDMSAEGFVKFYNESFRETTFRFMLHLYPILLSLLLGKKTLLLAQTLGPFWIFKFIMIYVLRKSTLITVRDAPSLKHLRDCRVDFSKVYLTADPTFLLDPASDRRVQTILKMEGLDLNVLKDKKKIGICAGHILKNKKHKRLVKTLATVADLLIERYNAIVLFISHASGKLTKKSNDVLVGEEIKNNVENKKRFYIIKGDYTPIELKGIIGRLDCLVSLRMHPVISASSMKVPSVIIAFNPKAYGLMEMLGLANNACTLVIHIDKVQSESLLACITCCLSDRHYLKKKLDENIPLVIEKAMLNINLLEWVLNENEKS